MTTRLPERGSALILAILLCSLLGGLALALLRMADTEAMVTAAGSRRHQLLNIAETGAAAVKTLFDSPVSGDSSMPRHLFLDLLDLRDPTLFNRSRRLLDVDGLSTTPPIPANGTSGREYHREANDLFLKPYVDGTLLSFLGTEDGPDLVLEDKPGVDLIDLLNSALIPDQRAGRIEKIEIFSAGLFSAGTAPRGIATAKITAAYYSAIESVGGIQVVRPGEAPRQRVVVVMTLGEIPVGIPRGPLEACGDISIKGPLLARWGKITTPRNILLPVTPGDLDNYIPSTWPYQSMIERIDDSPPQGNLSAWLSHGAEPVEDPWLKILAGGTIGGMAALADQPLPFDQSTLSTRDHSNLFQRVSGLNCPVFEYEYWKSIAAGNMPGDRGLHYFSFDSATGGFRRGGVGPIRSFREWTHGRSGIFFFDTTDGLPPDGTNLTPPVVIAGGEWNSAGIIYLNSVSFHATAVTGIDRVMLPPGEPFDDSDADLRHSPTEWHLNLRYPMNSTEPFFQDPLAIASSTAISPDGETYTVNTTTQRDYAGIPLVRQVNLFGVLYNSGEIKAEGDAVYYGSLQAGGDVVQTSTGLPTPSVFFDERLNTGKWPPPEIGMPRTYVISWRTIPD